VSLLYGQIPSRYPGRRPGFSPGFRQVRVCDQNATFWGRKQVADRFKLSACRDSCFRPKKVASWSQAHTNLSETRSETTLRVGNQVCDLDSVMEFGLIPCVAPTRVRCGGFFFTDTSRIFHTVTYKTDSGQSPAFVRLSVHGFRQNIGPYCDCYTRLHDTTGCQSGCTTGLTTGCIV